MTPPLPAPNPAPAAVAVAAAAPVVLIASWNLQSCSRGVDGIVKELKALGAEVVALQEVDRGTMRSGRIDQAATLAAKAGYPYFHFFAATPWDVGEYGVALLSKHPIEEARVEKLPITPGIEQRILGTAVVRFPSGPVSVNVTHLSHRVVEGALRVEQVKKIQAVLEKDPLPQLVLGDFNDTPGSRMHEAMAARFSDAFAEAGEGPRGTFPLPLPFSPAVQIDYVFSAGGVRAQNAKVVETAASDHYILTAKVQLPEQSVEAERPRAVAGTR